MTNNNDPETKQAKRWRYVAIIILCFGTAIYVFSLNEKNLATLPTSDVTTSVVTQQNPPVKTKKQITKRKKQDFNGIVIRSNYEDDSVEVSDDEGNHIMVPKPLFPVNDGNYVTVVVDEIPGYQILSDTVSNGDETLLASIDEISSDYVILSRNKQNGLLEKFVALKPSFAIRQDSDVLISQCNFYQYEIVEIIQ